MFLTLSILISFDAMPTNISCLLLPGLTLYKSKGSTNVSKLEKKSKPLYNTVRPTNLVKKELSILGSMHTYILSTLNKMYQDSFIQKKV
jgi:hypothetical protein